MKFRRFFKLLAVAPLAISLTAGCAAPPPPIAEGNVAPSQLPPLYRDKPDIRALARHSDGRFWATWAFCSVRDATAYALFRCEEKYGKSCHLEFVGPNRVDHLDAVGREAIAQAYETEARRR